MASFSETRITGTFSFTLEVVAGGGTPTARQNGWYQSVAGLSLDHPRHADRIDLSVPERVPEKGERLMCESSD